MERTDETNRIFRIAAVTIDLTERATSGRAL